MSGYEDPEGAGDAPGGGKKRLGALFGRRSRNGDDAWDDGAQSRKVPGRLGASGSARSSSAPPRTRSQRILGRHPVLSVLGILLTLTVTFISLTAYAAYRNVYDSIHHVTVTSGELGKRPPKLDGSTNILIIGSDSRAGTGGKYGRGIQGARSDTSMILHIPPNHNGALVVSMPRDTMVPIYQCDANGSGEPGQQAQPFGNVEQLNATYAYGGAPCLWKTLEQVTRIHIDHFVEVNFLSFKKIVRDVGGVPVCLPFAIDDPASGLHLAAGKHIVDGTQGLAFVRERHIGEGSDLQRINRQQIFLAALAQKIKASSTLSDPTKLYGLVHDIASSLTTDADLNELLAIADSLKGISTSSLQFITAPVAPYPGNPNNWVELWQPYANELFRSIARDNHLQRAARKDDRSTDKPVVTVSAKKVHVRVLNATNTPGLAATTASQLTTKGYRVAGTGNASASKTTIIEYNSAKLLPEADTLQEEIPGSQLKQVTSAQGPALNLVLGSSFKGLASAHKAKSSKSSVSKVVQKTENNTAGTEISGNTNICDHKSAFSGPDNPADFSNG
jgi:LCP family protein required for cell wall assembly